MLSGWRGQGQMEAQAPQVDMLERLKALSELKECGALSEEEFAAEKAKIMNPQPLAAQPNSMEAAELGTITPSPHHPGISGPSKYDAVPQPQPVITVEATSMNGGKFGANLYEVVEDMNRQQGCIAQQINACLGFKKEKTVSFYDTAIVITETRKFACYPAAYERIVIPRFNIVNTGIRKLRVDSWLSVGVLLIIIAIILFASGSGGDDDDDSSGSAIGGGVFCLLAGLFALIWPLLNVNYTVDLELRRGADSGFSFGFLKFQLPGTYWFQINTSVKPNDAFIFEYVYGPIAKDMETLCQLSHLNNANLVDVVRPKRLVDVGISSTVAY